MKTYYVPFPGLWLEGHLIVNEVSEEPARYRAFGYCIGNGFSNVKPEDLTVKEIPNTIGGHQFYNGDY